MVLFSLKGFIILSLFVLIFRQHSPILIAPLKKRHKTSVPVGSDCSVALFSTCHASYPAGASLVFLKAFDDLGTPLLLNVNNMLAPQAYLRISSIGISDPMGDVISVILVAFSLLALWAAALATASLPPWKRDVGMVSQNYALWPHMSVQKNVAFGLEERKTQKDRKSVV